MKWAFITRQIDYDGSQLASHFALINASLTGDSIVSFVGACEVLPEFMVDLSDLKAGHRIFSPKMLHFIAEHFEVDLVRATLRQRLLVSILQQELNSHLQPPGSRGPVRRAGDDLFIKRRKLTISVATTSPVSSLIHLGVNLKTEGVPVEAASISDVVPDASPQQIAEAVMKTYCAECESIEEAAAQVRGVGFFGAGEE